MNLNLTAAALNGTQRHARVRYVLAVGEFGVEVEQALELRVVEANGVAVDVMVDGGRVALARVGVHALQAEVNARVLRVLVVADVGNLLKECAIAQRARELLLNDGALAVRLGVLVVEEALDDELGAQVGRDLDDGLDLIERILGRVLDEHVEAAIVEVRADAVGQAGVELQLQVARLTRYIHRARSVGIEAIAVQIVRMKEVVEVARRALVTVELARDEPLLDVVEGRLLGVVEQRAALAHHVLLNLQVHVVVVVHRARKVGRLHVVQLTRLRQQVDGKERRKRVHVAENDRWKDRLVLIVDAICGNYLQSFS